MNELRYVERPSSPDFPHTHSLGKDTLFQFMADHSPVLLWLAREDGKRTFFNATWTDFTGRTLEQEWGNGWAEGVHPDDRRMYLEHYQGAVDRRVEYEMEYRLRRYDGQYRWILDRGVPVFEQGLFCGYIGSCLDITEIHEASDLLEKKNLQLLETTRSLEKSNKELENFAYLASHDLQAPMRTIASFAGLIKEELENFENPEIVQYLDYLTKAAVDMKFLIQALLDYSRIGNKSEHAFVKVDLNHLIGSLIKDDFADEKNLQVSFANLPSVFGVPLLLKQLFVNLLTNSIKFGKPHSLVKVRITGDDLTHSWRISVSDNGIGIDPAFLKRVFAIFSRGENDRKIPGTGIGLAICDKICSIHKGKIWCESIRGEGATFHFEIPK